jgi:predicted transcriptional regulator of viral defense system
MPRTSAERRDVTRREEISVRLRAALSSRSLLLTVEEVQRLLSLHREACQRILRHLEEGGVLREIQRGVYAPTPLVSGMSTP